MRKRVGVLAMVAALGSVGSFASTASAQQQVQVAATAFAEGQQAQLRGDFVRAAELFEIADQSVPSPAALRSAIRNREAAGQDVRAATLSLRAIERYPDDRETRAFAESAITRLGPKLARVRAHCDEPCTVTVDGGLAGSGTAAEFFVGAGPHTLRASWPGRPELLRPIETAAGQALELKFEAPPPPSAAPAPAASSPAPAPTSSPIASTPRPSNEASGAPSEEPRGGMSPAVFWVGTGLTAVAGGLLVWSGLDTLSARDDYEKSPSRSGYDDGVERERRTNILAGATVVLGLGTAGIGLFATDWGGSSRAAFRFGPSSAELAWSGVFP